MKPNNSYNHHHHKPPSMQEDKQDLQQNNDIIEWSSQSPLSMNGSTAFNFFRPQQPTSSEPVIDSSNEISNFYGPIASNNTPSAPASAADITSLIAALQQTQATQQVPTIFTPMHAGMAVAPSWQAMNQTAPSEQMQSFNAFTGLLQSYGASSSSTTNIATKTPRTASSCPDPFPQKLYRMLEETEARGLSHIVSFTPSGDAFRIHDKRAFMAEVSPEYFRQKNLQSFKRQLNHYDFRLMHGGVEDGAYKHEHFRKGRPDLLHRIRRTGSSHQKEVLSRVKDTTAELSPKNA